MPIPDYETLMLPLMHFTEDGKEHSLKEVTLHLADLFKLTAEEREQRIPSGQASYIQNRTGWAKTYLKKAGLLSSPKRGLIEITDRGREVLAQKPERINREFLEQFPEFVEFQNRSNLDLKSDETAATVIEKQTPEETIERCFTELRSQLADELLEQIKACTADFFERLVVDVIVAMGYVCVAPGASRITSTRRHILSVT